MQLNFNAFDYDPSQGAAICFPLGDYKVEITAAEGKGVKDNPTAGYLELSLTVVEGDFRGMVQKDRLNIFHTNEVAKRIGHSQLSAYCFAINRPYVQNTEDLIGGRCICTLGPQDGSDKYSEVKAVKCMDGTNPKRPQQNQQGVSAAPSAPHVPVQPPNPPHSPTPVGVPSEQPAQPAQPPQQVAPPWNNAPAAPAGNAPAWVNSGAVPPTQPGNAGGAPPWAKA
jgi:hypothetical protein